MRTKPDFKRSDHMLDDADFSYEEYMSMLELAQMLKRAHYEGIQVNILRNKVLGMMFDQPSTRTRVSFETAMTKLGGHAEFLEMKTLHVGEGHETMRDTAEIVSRMVDAIMIRTGSQEAVEEFAKYCFCPVINGCTLDMHPSQVLCDVLTMREHLPEVPFEDMVFMNMGDCNRKYDHFCPTQGSMWRVAALLGMTYICCGPKEMWICEEDRELFWKLAERSGRGAKLLFTEDPYEYIEQVDFTFSDAWWYHGAESEDFKKRRLDLLYPKYQVNQSLVNAGKPTLGVMHCLPGFRDYEITSEVWDGPNSLLFEEGENRLHAEKAICTWFMYGTERSAAVQSYHQGAIEDFVLDAFARLGKGGR